MRPGRVRTRSFVMGLVAWCALSLAPVVALSPALAATFLLLASALAACATLRFSLAAGVVSAVVSAVLFTIVLALLQTPSEALNPGGLAGSVFRLAIGLPAMVGAVSLAGAVAFAELVSMGLEWDVVLRRTADVRGLESGDPAIPARKPRHLKVMRRKEDASRS